jgi:hypothetical protein
MVDFLVVALPRCGTTWASNWLTTDTTLCLHDALAYKTFYEIDKEAITTKKLGLSDTGVFAYGEKLNKHPAKKVILHRDIVEINKSLNDLGLSSIPDFSAFLDNIDGLHVHYSDLFNNPEPIWNHLIGNSFDSERHTLLKQMSIQPAFAALAPVDKKAVERYFNEIRR